jgi:hypothetical protein
MEVTIRTEAGLLRLDAEALDTAMFLANVFGYSLDLEPTGTGGYTLTATHWRSDNRITANGKTIKAVSKKLIELLTNEVQGA